MNAPVMHQRASQVEIFIFFDSVSHFITFAFLSFSKDNSSCMRWEVLSKPFITINMSNAITQLPLAYCKVKTVKS